MAKPKASDTMANTNTGATVTKVYRVLALTSRGAEGAYKGTDAAEADRIYASLEHAYSTVSVGPAFGPAPEYDFLPGIISYENTESRHK